MTLAMMGWTMVECLNKKEAEGGLALRSHSLECFSSELREGHGTFACLKNVQGIG